jgi:hypothetical protein
MVSKAKWPGGRFEATFRLAVFSFVAGVQGWLLFEYNPNWFGQSPRFVAKSTIQAGVVQAVS